VFKKLLHGGRELLPGTNAKAVGNGKKKNGREHGDSGYFVFRSLRLTRRKKKTKGGQKRKFHVRGGEGTGTRGGLREVRAKGEFLGGKFKQRLYTNQLLCGGKGGN